jgi:hypothetical protein
MLSPPYDLVAPTFFDCHTPKSSTPIFASLYSIVATMDVAIPHPPSHDCEPERCSPQSTTKRACFECSRYGTIFPRPLLWLIVEVEKKRNVTWPFQHVRYVSEQGLPVHTRPVANLVHLEFENPSLIHQRNRT